MPLTFDQFSVLYTNVAAITAQTFNFQCAQTAAAASAENPDKLATISQPQLPDIQALEDFIAAGYSDIEAVQAELQAKQLSLDLVALEQCIAAVPGNLPSLCHKLSGAELARWIEFALTQQQDSPFYQLHYLMAGNTVDLESVEDQIREAIAFDDVLPLAGVQLNAADISLENLTMAAQIGSFKVLEALFAVRRLNVDEQRDILQENFIDATNFKRLMALLQPEQAMLVTLKSSAPPEIVALIDQYSE